VKENFVSLLDSGYTLLLSQAKEKAKDM